MSSPVEEALRSERDGAAIRRRMLELPDGSWLQGFPSISEAYCFCLLRIDDNDDEKAAEKMAKALEERYQSAQGAWEQILKSWPYFSPDEVLYTHKYHSGGLAPPGCANGIWPEVQSAARDFEALKDEGVGSCLDQFEAMSRAADFICGMARSLG